MYFFPIFIILCTVFCQKVGTLPDISRLNKTSDSSETQLDQVENSKQPIIINIKQSASENLDRHVSPKNLSATNRGNNSSDTNITTFNHTSNSNTKNNVKIDQTSEEETEIESGAITRGILVVVGISCLFILYVGIKTYRRKNHDKSKLIIRRYGVRTHRSDIEMEPLPLSDDEEDETVFDLTASRTTYN